MRTSLRTFIGLLLLFGLAISPLQAQEGGAGAHSGLGFGLKAGFGLDPDQFVVGAQFSLGEPLGVFRVVPNFDVGFGDDQTTIDFNADFLVRLLVENTNVALYGGGAPTIAYRDVNQAGSEWEVGFTAVAGIQLPIFPGYGSNLEARFGVGDIPDFRLLFAFLF